MRTGYTAAESWARQGSRLGARHRRHVGSALFWGALVPVLALASLLLPAALVAWPVRLGTLGLLVLGYAVLFLRIVRDRRRRGTSARASRIYARFCLLGKGPEVQGILRYWRNRLRRRDAQWIEYKDVPAPAPPAPADEEPR